MFLFPDVKPIFSPFLLLLSSFHYQITAARIFRNGPRIDTYLYHLRRGALARFLGGREKQVERLGLLASMGGNENQLVAGFH